MHQPWATLLIAGIKRYVRVCDTPGLMEEAVMVVVCIVTIVIL